MKILLHYLDTTQNWEIILLDSLTLEDAEREAALILGSLPDVDHRIVLLEDNGRTRNVRLSEEVISSQKSLHFAATQKAQAERVRRQAEEIERIIKQSEQLALENSKKMEIIQQINVENSVAPETVSPLVSSTARGLVSVKSDLNDVKETKENKNIFKNPINYAILLLYIMIIGLTINAIVLRS